MRGSSGNSLMEMVVVLAILSLLATMAAPYATKSFKRDKEIQLRETLRTVERRSTSFTPIWRVCPPTRKAGQRAVRTDILSRSMFSSTELRRNRENGEQKRKRYLRSLPVNPFAPPGAPLDVQWTLVSFQNEAPVVASSSYGTTLAETQTIKKDIYDLHAKTAAIALDGTRYADW